MPRRQQPQFPVQFTQVQRKAVAEVVPELADRLRLEEPGRRNVLLTLAELKNLQSKTVRAIRKVESLRHLMGLTSLAVERARGAGGAPSSGPVYQFKITLRESRPPIWRRIQVQDCVFDKLHEHIQTAMGWTNSHLHHFRINGALYGDPMLMEEDFEEVGYQNSMTAKLSDVLPRTGEPFRFEYEYDFGDSWEHEVLFESMVPARSGRRYPLCVEGERACPPEDVGGVGSYETFQEAIADPDHERHDQFTMWIGGPFDPEAFDAAVATSRMRRGLPDWRKMR